MNKKKVLGMVEKMLRIKVEENQAKWPPNCAGIFHQPQRPINRLDCHK